MESEWGGSGKTCQAGVKASTEAGEDMAAIQNERRTESAAQVRSEAGGTGRDGVMKNLSAMPWLCSSLQRQQEAPEGFKQGIT